MPQIAIDTATIGDNTIVAGVAGLRVNVTNIVLVASAPVSVRWKSAATNISGAMALTSNSGYAVNAAVAVLRTAVQGDSLILNLSAAVQVSGHMGYYLSPDTTP